jgi:hypothetical protein
MGFRLPCAHVCQKGPVSPSRSKISRISSPTGLRASGVRRFEYQATASCPASRPYAWSTTSAPGAFFLIDSMASRQDCLRV